LGLKRTNVHLPKRLGARIASLLQGKEKQAEFIRTAIAHEIERREAEKKKPGRK
jgi:metal-responsive CopG/Arc/MetJ family transcriptional regulator